LLALAFLYQLLFHFRKPDSSQIILFVLLIVIFFPGQRRCVGGCDSDGKRVVTAKEEAKAGRLNLTFLLCLFELRAKRHANFADAERVHI
jgi:hypothetical protein